MKIIHFTKQRPLQYRAFLESFLYNLDINVDSQVIVPIDGPAVKNYPITTIISGTERL